MKMKPEQWYIAITCLLILLALLIAEYASGSEPADSPQVLTREEAILDIVSPRKKHISKLPYFSKRIAAYKDASYRRELVESFERASDEFGLPVNLLIAIAYRETVFRPHAEGNGGERGIMQTKPFVINRFCKNHCKQIETASGGILCGSCWLAKGVKNCGGDIQAGISAYVSGSCKPMARKTKQAVQNRIWLWKHLDKLTGENHKVASNEN